MEKTPPLYTATMAKVLEDQAKYPEALSIYRRLALDNPERPELLEALDRVKKRMGQKFENQLSRLIENWVDLLCLEDRVSRLRYLKNHIGKY